MKTLKSHLGDTWLAGSVEHVTAGLTSQGCEFMCHTGYRDYLKSGKKEKERHLRSRCQERVK